MIAGGAKQQRQGKKPASTWGGIVVALRGIGRQGRLGRRRRCRNAADTGLDRSSLTPSPSSWKIRPDHCAAAAQLAVGSRQAREVKEKRLAWPRIRRDNWYDLLRKNQPQAPPSSPNQLNTQGMGAFARPVAGVVLAKEARSPPRAALGVTHGAGGGGGAPAVGRGRAGARRRAPPRTIAAAGGGGVGSGPASAGPGSASWAARLVDPATPVAVVGRAERPVPPPEASDVAPLLSGLVDDIRAAGPVVISSGSAMTTPAETVERQRLLLERLFPAAAPSVLEMLAKDSAALAMGLIATARDGGLLDTVRPTTVVATWAALTPNGRPCPRWHVDRVPLRLVCSYVGRSTEWLADEDALWSGEPGKIPLRTAGDESTSTDPLLDRPPPQRMLAVGSGETSRSPWRGPLSHWPSCSGSTVLTPSRYRRARRPTPGRVGDPTADCALRRPAVRSPVLPSFSRARPTRVVAGAGACIARHWHPQKEQPRWDDCFCGSTLIAGWVHPLTVKTIISFPHRLRLALLGRPAGTSGGRGRGRGRWVGG